MITIPTGDLVGILSDVIPFAFPKDEDPSANAVHIEWDGKALHAMATDRYHLGWSTWSPDAPHEQEHQDSLFTDWGGADDPWASNVSLDDAKHLVKTYKLGPKEHYTPLTVDMYNGELRLERLRESGHSAIKSIVRDTVEGFPDLRKLLAANDTVRAVTNLDFNANYLAHFAKVRPRGPLRMRYTGPDRLVHVEIGEWFVGAIMPIRGQEKVAADILKHGSGVLLASPQEVA